MGNPLSGVLTCLFLEFSESGPFKYLVILLILDILTIYTFSYPQNIKIEEMAERFNNVEPSINFTYEKKIK